jgi:cytochrome c peroxidase
MGFLFIQFRGLVQRSLWVRRCAGAAFVVLVSTAGVLSALTQAELPARNEPFAPIALKVDIDPRRVALGERLFHDVRLSRDNLQSCSSCHPLDRGGMDGLPVARLSDGSSHLRNTPMMFNAALNFAYNWDGVTNSLEEHAERVLTNLMNITWPDLLTKLQSDEAYVRDFKAAYGDEVTRAYVLDAITSFERSLLTPNSRFDRYLRGDHTALNAREQDGYRLFKVYGCSACHQGVNVGGNLYQKFGVFEYMVNARSPLQDLGRFRVTQVPRDREVFRVPSLRNVAVTGPYFHDGRESKLEAAVETMTKAQLGTNLTSDQIGRIVAFLRTLTGEYKGRPVTASPEEVR